MKEFNWNGIKEHCGSFWDSDRGQIEPFHQEYKSDKELLNNRGAGFENRVALEALCRVVSELIEIEENRYKYRKKYRRKKYER